VVPWLSHTPPHLSHFSIVFGSIYNKQQPGASEQADAHHCGKLPGPNFVLSHCAKSVGAQEQNQIPPGFEHWIFYSLYFELSSYLSSYTNVTVWKMFFVPFIDSLSRFLLVVCCSYFLVLHFSCIPFIHPLFSLIQANINTEPDFINTQAIVARCLVMNLAYPQIQDALSELLESSELSSDVMFFSAASLGIEGYEVNRQK